MNSQPQKYANQAAKKLLTKQSQIMIQIRRNNRHQIIQKRRQLNTLFDLDPSHAQQVQEQKDIQEEVVEQNVSKTSSKQKKSSRKRRREKEKILKRLEDAIIMIRSGQEQLQENGVREVRKVLCLKEYTPIQEVIDFGLVPFFMQLASQDKEPLRVESAWILLNLCNGTPEQIRFLIEKGMLKLISNFLSFNNLTLIDNAMWIFGNIASEPTLLSLILPSKIIEKIIEAVDTIASIQLLKNAAWSFSNLCRNKAALSQQRIKKIVVIFLTAWGTTTDKEALYYQVLWGMSNIAHTEAAQLTLMQPHVLQKFIEIMAGTDQTKKISVARILSALCTSKHNTEIIFVPKLFFILNQSIRSQDPRVKIQSMYLINKACQHSAAVITTFSNTEVFMKHLAKMSECQDAKLILNIIAIYKSFALELPFKTAVSVFAVYQLMRCFVLFLSSSIFEIVIDALDAIASIFEICDRRQQNPFVEMFNMNNGVHILETLQNQASEEIYDKSIAIIEAFYEIDESLQ